MEPADLLPCAQESAIKLISWANWSEIRVVWDVRPCNFLCGLQRCGETFSSDH